LLKGGLGWGGSGAGPHKNPHPQPPNPISGLSFCFFFPKTKTQHFPGWGHLSLPKTSPSGDPSAGNPHHQQPKKKTKQHPKTEIQSCWNKGTPKSTQQNHPNHQKNPPHKKPHQAIFFGGGVNRFHPPRFWFLGFNGFCFFLAGLLCLGGGGGFSSLGVFFFEKQSVPPLDPENKKQKCHLAGLPGVLGFFGGGGGLGCALVFLSKNERESSCG